MNAKRLQEQRGVYPGRRSTDILLTQIIERLDSQDRTLEAQNETLGDMKEDIATVREILSAWNSVKLVGAGIKWLAGVIAAAGIIWAAWTHKG